ncbi:protein import receptor MAS20 [Exidia glandulosa HHB12029]|uniref:Protein import receptor MAS20 n=1 Tax=Exidia glandulosa HHB12029 TaxID=1314781 RepID=A0A165QKR0_EXIGL|nr:protein import receptor MAS20 [Exidia glandulosa HHB12029]
MSSQRSTTTTALVVTGAVVLGGVIAYAAYFDYKRRNDIQFRKQLRKEHKKVKRAKTERAAAATAATTVSDQEITAALERIRKEPLPTTNQDREQYFTKHVADGEMMSVQGPAMYFEAALSFYRGLRVYPVPVELVMIYQKTLPEPIFNILMKLTSLDVSPSAAGAGRGAGTTTEIPIIFEDGIDDDGASSSAEWDRVNTGANSPSSSVHIS